MLDLSRFGSALRLRWLWMAWQDPPRPWARSPLPCDNKERMLFAMATEITIGNGMKANFWNDRWLHGQCPKTIAPTLFKISNRKNRTVHEALRGQAWLSDLAMGLTDDMIPELTYLARMLDNIVLQDGQPDEIAWRFTANSEYSARSAYMLQFEGSIPIEGYKLVWKGWAPGKCRFFLWTAMLGKILTADALLHRGWENNYFCPLCERNLETPSHLLIECPWSQYAWGKIARLHRMPALLPESWTGNGNIKGWLTNCYNRATEDTKKGTLSIMQLMSWELWRERNRRIFQQELMEREGFVAKVRDEIHLWNLAGAGIPFDPG